MVDSLFKGRSLGTYVLFFLCWMTAGAVLVPPVMAFLHSDQGVLENKFAVMLGLHVLSGILLFFAVPRGRGWFHVRRLWSRTAVTFALFLPVFGWLMSGLLFLFYRDPVTLSVETEEFENDLVLPPDVLEFSLLKPPVREQKLYRELDFMPLADILAGENVNLKCGAIDKLVQLATPEAIAILLGHRSDPLPEVRFYVTSALTKIKKEMDEELDAAKRRIKLDVHDISSRIFMAKIYLQYVASGLLDDSSAQMYMREARHHLEYVSRFPDAPDEANFLLIGIHNSRRDWGLALEVIDRMSEDTPELGKLKVEILYGAGEYARLIDELRCLKLAGFYDPRWDAAAYLWGVGS